MVNVEEFQIYGGHRRQSNDKATKRRDTESAMRGRKQPIKPDGYDGKSCIEAYLSKFESISEYNEWISCASQGVNISYQVKDLAVCKGQKVCFQTFSMYWCSLEDILQGVRK